MRSKSIHQLWAQLGRIRDYFNNPNSPEQAKRLNKACEICNQYGKDAWEYVIANNPGISSSDAVHVPVPVAEYCKCRNTEAIPRYKSTYGRDFQLTKDSLNRQNGSHQPGKWCWIKCVWCGAVPASPDFDTINEAIAYAVKEDMIVLTD